MYKWKPSKKAKKEFAIKMQTDPEFARQYKERKDEKAIKRRATSKFDYPTAGGEYIPSTGTYEEAKRICWVHGMPNDVIVACNAVIWAYENKEKTHHD
jgi:hypothetical protein